MQIEQAKPHAVCVPFPAQGHINPILKLAKLLHFKSFHITFVHTDFNYNRLLSCRGQDALKGSPSFRFGTMTDGLPSTNQRLIQDLPALCSTLPVHGLRLFRDLIRKRNASPDVPPVTCIVSDGVMSFTLEVAEEFDESCLINGYLDTIIDWIPGMEGIRLKDLPAFLRTTNTNDIMFNYNIQSVNNSMEARALILNTFDDLEREFLDTIKTKFTSLYTIGPLHLLHRQLCAENLNPIESNLWKEDHNCMDWLDKREPRSVLYANYGSLITVTREQLREFAWGLPDSNYTFLWVIRADAVDGGDEILSKEFMEEIKDRGLLVRWCPQEKVLSHIAVGGYLTHCGKNSTLESIGEGVPLICWPFFAEQQTNCLFSCTKWGIGIEIEGDVKRGKIQGLLREVMEGEQGKGMRQMGQVWKKKAEAATSPCGSSFRNFERLVEDLEQGAIGQ